MVGLVGYIRVVGCVRSTGQTRRSGISTTKGKVFMIDGENGSRSRKSKKFRVEGKEELLRKLMRSEITTRQET